MSLGVLDGDRWYRHMMLHGRGTLHDDTALSNADRIARRYTGGSYGQRDRGRMSAWIAVGSWHAWTAAGRGLEAGRGRPAA